MAAKIGTAHDGIRNIGIRFGRLTTLKLTKKTRRYNYYLCKCDCGVEKEVKWEYLLAGTTQSCGCIHKESYKNRKRKPIEETAFNIVLTRYKQEDVI